MKKILNVYKAILIWSTVFSCLLLLCSAESIIENEKWGLLLLWGIFECCIVLFCKEIVTEKEFFDYTGTTYICNKLKLK